MVLLAQPAGPAVLPGGCQSGGMDFVLTQRPISDERRRGTERTGDARWVNEDDAERDRDGGAEEV